MPFPSYVKPIEQTVQDMCRLLNITEYEAYQMYGLTDELTGALSLIQVDGGELSLNISEE